MGRDSGAIGSISWTLAQFMARITLPVGMMAGAIEMLAAGVVLMIASMVGRKRQRSPAEAMRSGYLAVWFDYHKLTLICI